MIDFKSDDEEIFFFDGERWYKKCTVTELPPSVRKQVAELYKSIKDGPLSGKQIISQEEIDTILDAMERRDNFE
jgi:hypothetical protein